MSDAKRIDEIAAPDSARRSDSDARRSEGAALARDAKPAIERVVVRAERTADGSTERAVDRSRAHDADRGLDRSPTERDDSLAHSREPRRRVPQPDILNIDEAAELLGVSIKTFNKVLHNENMPARKIGREWKFSRQALIDWVGSGQSQDFYRESSDDDAEEADVEIKPQPTAPSERPKSRRTAGWQIEFD
jgi:excisionase family DNA binding protein